MYTTIHIIFLMVFDNPDIKYPSKHPNNRIATTHDSNFCIESTCKNTLLLHLHQTN